MKRYLTFAFALGIVTAALLLGINVASARHATTPIPASASLFNTSLLLSPSPTASSTLTPCSPLSTWAQAQPLTEPVGGLTVSSDASFVYAVDGYDYAAGHLVSQFAKYDPTTNHWTDLPAPPIAFYGASAVYSPGNGKLYVFGGYHDSGVPLTTTRIFDFGSSSWSSGAPMPAALGGMGAAYASGKIFLVGGDAGGGVITGQNWAYDPAADSWMTMTALPAARVAPAVGIINGHLYAAGGLTPAFAEANSLFDYNIATDSWTSRANLTVADFGGAGVAAGGKLYVMGGGFPSARGAGVNAVRNITLIYDPSTDSWSDGPLLNQGRSFAGAAAVGNTMVVVGGDITSNAATNSTEVASLLSCPTATPTSTPTLSPTNTITPPPTTTLTATATATATDTPLPLPSVTPTDCPNQFVDVTGNVFYTAIHYLNCRGVVGGTDATHYAPGGTSTRGQFAKVVVLGFGTPLYTPAGNPDFSDVPSTYFAYLYIETGYHAAILSGFDSAGCTSHGATYPCYLPNLAITRGQLTKLVVGAAGYPLYTPTSGPTFTDVPTSNVFYASIETAAHMAVVSGYPDRTFRPNNFIRRDEMAQIVYKGVITP